MELRYIKILQMELFKKHTGTCFYINNKGGICYVKNVM